MHIKILKVAHLNITSLTAHFSDLKEFVVTNEYDIIAISETWLTAEITSSTVGIKGYNFYRVDRPTRGGGVGMYVKATFKCSILVSDTDIEQLWIKIILNKISYCVGVAYKPPTFNFNNFLNSFEKSISNAVLVSDYVVCAGDFNVNLFRTENLNTNRLLLLCDSLGLKQVIDTPTYMTKTSLSLIDLIFISSQIQIKDKGTCSVNNVKGHELIFCTLEINIHHTDKIPRTYRDFKNFDHEQFLLDLQHAPLYHVVELNDIDNKVKFLNDCVLNLFNLHAPLITSVAHNKRYVPWLTDNLKLLMSLRDKAAAKFKRTKLAAHWDYYKSLRNLTNKTVNLEKKAYFEYKLNRSNGDKKILWRELKRLSVVNKSKQAGNIPSHLKDVDKINRYFIDSVPVVDGNSKDELIGFYNSNNKTNFTEKFRFCDINDETTFKIINSITTKAYGVDNISIDMIKLCSPYIIPIITHLVNFCFSNAVFPNIWKQSRITPLPKKNQPTEYKDLRPISILPVMSKIIEKAMALQLRRHIEKYHILPECQSGFRPGYSCSTALINIIDDIIGAIDQGRLTVLILLDFSKAFDTLDHDILKSILHYIGFDLPAIHIFNAYLSERMQRVCLDGNVSESALVSTGVPQGSILGPILFTIYTCHLMENALKHCQYHLYADDTQMYLSFPPENIDTAIIKINEDLQNLAEQSKLHSLSLNPTKTNVMLFGRRNDKAIVNDHVKLYLNNTLLLLKDEATSLGVIVDHALRFKTHVRNCIGKAYCNLKLIYANRYMLNKKLKIMLCDLLVLSQFNYADTLYTHCIDAEDCRRIQLVQNNCLRLIYGIKKYERITYKLKETNWLNMRKRRENHYSVLYYKILLTKVPPYLSRKITYRTEIHNLNLRHRGIISMPSHNTSFFQRGFSYNICKFFNKLPLELKGLSVTKFKRNFKMWLMEQHV